MAEQATKEPTMEEILSSIRRIISEDGTPVGEASGGDVSSMADDDDFLGLGEDLVEQANEQVDVAEGEHLLSVDELLESESDFSDFEALTDFEGLDAAPQAGNAPSENALDEVFDSEALDQSVAEIEASVFAEAEQTSAPNTHAEAQAAIAAVAEAASSAKPAVVAREPEQAAPQAPVAEAPAAPVAAPQAANPLLGASAAGNPIENMVSELMRPMIKEWIDTNLPGIVERKVEAEIQQVANKVVAALRND